ncbi:hypothetical protein B9Z19DRAFT_1121718 [Tuber borchii]|uniref:Uncharacterized protein n=1 Tax=Tuber borchii TaxID=42251 RepID=A0A2T7A276_TUBBO|nr:hypothetical protein B9Z19DRAFT_1121718 [Tuber borchii]
MSGCGGDAPQKHRGARVFRRRPLDNFEELCEIFGDTGQTVSATGAQADEDADEEVEDQEMDDEGGPSAQKTGATQSTYQDSPIPNVNGAQASDLPLPARPAPAPVWGSSLYSPSPRSQRNDIDNTAGPGRPRHDYHEKALTNFARVFALQMDELIATIKSHHEMKVKQVPTQFLPFAEAVGKAVKLYQKGEISKTDFTLAISSLKHNPPECRGRRRGRNAPVTLKLNGREES